MCPILCSGVIISSSNLCKWKLCPLGASYFCENIMCRNYLLLICNYCEKLFYQYEFLDHQLKCNDSCVSEYASFDSDETVILDVVNIDIIYENNDRPER